MIRTLMALATVAMCSGAFAQPGGAGGGAATTPPNAGTTSAAPAGGAAPMGDKMSTKKTRAQCKADGVKGTKAMKACMSGK